MIVAAAAIAAVALGIAIAMIILAGRQSHERPGYIDLTGSYRHRRWAVWDSETEQMRQDADAPLQAAGSSRVRAESWGDDWPNRDEALAAGCTCRWHTRLTIVEFDSRCPILGSHRQPALTGHVASRRDLGGDAA